MKRQIRYTIFAAAALLMAACAKSDEPHTSGTQLSFQIVDAGYAPTTPTRAAENGFATQFTEGDQCGLYIVSGGEVVAANVKLTATSTGLNGAVEWTPDTSAGTLWHTPGDQYFVYYPWHDEPTGAPTAGQKVSAKDDAEFFAGVIDAWTPAIDQSNYSTGYTTSDLMTASETIGDRTSGIMHFSFQMTHRMALAVVEMPAKTNTESVTAVFSGEEQPCHIQGVYRYLVNPLHPQTLNGSYADGTKDFSITPTGIAGGSYKTYKVDGGLPEIPQVGDFFYSDGSWSTELNRNKKVIGIVFQTDPERIGKAEKEALAAKGVTAPHGLVIAVKNAATSVSWGPQGTDETLTNCESPEQNNDNNSGYHNTRSIWLVRNSFNSYPAFNAADKYNTACPAPDKTTDWYLPATGQWYDLLRNLGGLDDWEASSMDIPAGDHKWSDQGNVCDALNRWMKDVDEADLFNDVNNFWSSSEFSNVCARMWNFNADGTVGCLWDSKGLEYAVRAVLAF